MSQEAAVHIFYILSTNEEKRNVFISKEILSNVLNLPKPTEFEIYHKKIKIKNPYLCLML